MPDKGISADPGKVEAIVNFKAPKMLLNVEVLWVS